MQVGVQHYPSFHSGNCVYNEVHLLQSILLHILSTKTERLSQAKNTMRNNLNTIFSADGPISFVAPNRVCTSIEQAFLFASVAMARQKRYYIC